MTTKSSGSCLCGQVKFEIDGPLESFYLCHCKYCQKDTGSAYAANLFSSTARLIWIAGQEMAKSFNLPSTRHTKTFCRECGSALPNTQMGGKLVMVPAGSLDTEVLLKPNAHIFCSSQSRWEQNLDQVAKFERFPGSAD